jgi:hypothetical protein
MPRLPEEAVPESEDHIPVLATQQLADIYNKEKENFKGFDDTVNSKSLRW